MSRPEILTQIEDWLLQLKETTLVVNNLIASILIDLSSFRRFNYKNDAEELTRNTVKGTYFLGSIGDKKIWINPGRTKQECIVENTEGGVLINFEERGWISLVIN